MNCFYDLHIHSCLSPCGDNDMTPNNIAGMAAVCGLNIIALTDHNSAKNCPALAAACAAYGVAFVPGMELTTMEEIHTVCLFPTLEAALCMDEIVYARLPDIKNRADLFGEQIIMDEEDRRIGREDTLLLNATDISLDEAVEIVAGLGGVCYPAHIDRESFSVTSSLGVFPDTPCFCSLEVSKNGDITLLERRYPNIQGRRVLYSSDAHYLPDINEAIHCLHLPACTAEALIEKLKT